MDTVLKVNDLTIDFDVFDKRLTALKNVSFSVPARQTTALVGESGSGKSACCNAIMGLLPKNGHICQGEILFKRDADSEVINLTKLGSKSSLYRQIRGQSMSMVFQEPMVSLSPLHTIGNQISEALLIRRNISKKEAQLKTKKMLAAVGFHDSEASFKRYPFELSGGLRQRAMIAMSLVCQPSLLIADEPTTALDVTIQAQILELLQQLQEDMHMAILLVTHDMGVVASVADYVVVLYKGEVVEKGKKDDIFRSPQHPYVKNLLKSVPSLSTDKQKRLPTLYKVESSQHFFSVKENILDKTVPLIEISGINKSFVPRKKGQLFGSVAPVKVLHDIDFKIYPGETFGLVGESGCGKTTLCKILLQGLKADSGKVELNIHNNKINLTSAPDSALREYRKHVQYIFQDPQSALNPKMTIQQILLEPFDIHNVGQKKDRKDWVQRLVQLVGLNIQDLSRYPHHFSGGQKQRINIARAIALQPELILCDEPVSALDVSIQAQILNLLKDLQRDLHLTYLFISHNMAVVRYMADRIAVMAKGHLVELGNCNSIFSNPLHPYTKALINSILDINIKDKPASYVGKTEGTFSDPRLWPEPFCFKEEEPTYWYEFEAEHFVRLPVGKVLS